MVGFIGELIEVAKRRKVFKRNKKSLKVKILSRLLYFFGLSLRKTSLCLHLKRSHMNQFGNKTCPLNTNTTLIDHSIA